MVNGTIKTLSSPFGTAPMNNNPEAGAVLWGGDCADRSKLGFLFFLFLSTFLDELQNYLVCAEITRFPRIEVGSLSINFRQEIIITDTEIRAEHGDGFSEYVSSSRLASLFTVHKESQKSLRQQAREVYSPVGQYDGWHSVRES